MSQGVAGKTKIAVDTGTLADGDSIASYLVDSAGALLTSTLVGGTKQSLDVNVTQSALPAGAATETTLASLLAELQSITFNEDDAAVSGSAGIQIFAQRKDTGGSLVSADGDLSLLQVDASGNLRTTAVVDFAGDYAEDSPHTSGDIGLFSLAVRNSALASVTSADGDYSQFSVDARGGLLGASNYAEDSAHVSADVGNFVMAVRNQNQATTLTSATGDYSGIAVDDKGAVFTKSAANKSNLQQVITVGTSAVALPTTPLTDRNSIFVQMLSSGQLYVGSATVTNAGATRGLMLGNGGFVNVDAGPGNAVYGIANAAGKEVAVWEFA